MQKLVLSLALMASVAGSACGGSKSETLSDAGLADGSDEFDANQVFSLVSQVPEPDATEVSRDTEVGATFSKNLSETSVSAAELRIGDSLIVADVRIDGASLRIVPKERLIPNAEYQVLLKEEVQSYDGQSLPEVLSWTFSTASRSWKSSTKISTDTESLHTALSASITNKGHAVATFGHDALLISEDYRPWYNHFDPSLGWVGPFEINNFVEYDGGNHIKLRAAAAEESMIALFSRSISVPDIESSTIDLTAQNFSWSDPSPIAETTEGQHRIRLLSVSPSGRGLALWRYNDNGTLYDDQLHAAHYAPGSGWTTDGRMDSDEEKIADETLGPVESHGIINDAGQAVAVWRVYAESDLFIHANCYLPDNATNPGWQDTAVITPPTSFLIEPFVDMNESGEGIMLWHTTYEVWYSQFTLGTACNFGPAQKLRTSEQIIHLPTAAVNNDGTMMAVWGEGYSDAPQPFWSQYQSSATGWTPAVQFSTVGGDRRYFEWLRTNHKGQAVLVWNELSETDIYDVHAMVFESGTGWSEPVAMGPQSQFSQQVFVDFDINQLGDVIVIWRQNSGPDFGIWAKQYY